METPTKIYFALWLISLGLMWWFSYDEAHKTLCLILCTAALVIPVAFAIPPSRNVNLFGTIAGLAVLNAFGYCLVYHVCISVQIILFLLIYLPARTQYK